MDRVKLEAAISAARMYPQMFGAIDPFGKNPGATGFLNLRDDYAKALADAAEAHLATLPRKVKVTRWMVLQPEGTWGYYISHEAATQAAALRNANVVELTGYYETTDAP